MRDEEPQDQADAREARTEASAVAREARAEVSGAAREARGATLAAVAEGLEALSRAVETNMSEERLSGIVAAEQEINQRKFARLNAILALTLVVLVIGLTSIWIQSRANHAQGARTQRIGADAAVVADYVKTCLTNQGPRDVAKCGADNTAKVVGGLVKFINCDILALPGATQARLDACATGAFGQ